MRIQRDDEEQKLEFMEKMQNVVTNERLQTAVYAASLGKSLAGLAMLVFMILKIDTLKFPAQDNSSFVIAFMTGMKILLFVFAAILAISVIQNVIALVIVVRGDEGSLFGERFLRIVTAVKSGLSYLFMAAFGVAFGGMGAFAAFAKDVQKDDGVEIFGIVFLLIGIGMVISSLVSGVKSVKADLNSLD